MLAVLGELLNATLSLGIAMKLFTQWYIALYH